MEELEFTQHVLERYVERAMGKVGSEIKQFLAQNEQLVKDQIMKLYQYSEPFWEGKNKEHNYTYFRINKNGWLIVIDKNKSKLVTLYKIDLGLGEDFNKEYIQAMTENVKELNTQIEESRNSYSEVKEQNDKTIEELKTENNLLQSQMKTNLTTIDFLEKQKELELQNISTKELELKAKIEKFVGAKMF